MLKVRQWLRNRRKNEGVLIKIEGRVAAMDRTMMVRADEDKIVEVTTDRRLHKVSASLVRNADGLVH
jgi:hypothetical protein